ncbi:MAG: hypothetical protein WB770_11975 [Acidimicrobiales bacterium]
MTRLTAKLSVCLSLAGLLIGSAIVTESPAGATPSTCGVVSVALVDAKLGIAAAHVNARRPSSVALICSYYGNSGRASNEATINYLPASKRTFLAIEASLAKTHSIRRISGIKSGAYTYVAGTERFLYVLDNTTQVQMFAIDSVSLGRLEALARALPLFS